MLLQSLVLLFFVGQAHGHVYSCLEVADQYSNWDQLKHITLSSDKTSTSLFDVATSSTYCVAKNSPSSQWTVQSGLFDLDCDQEFTFIISRSEPSLIPAVTAVTEHAVRRETVVVPQTGMVIWKGSCVGDGNVTFYTGVGVDENEHMFEMQSWKCSVLPDLIVSFDNVITIETDSTVTYEMLTSSDVDQTFMVYPGDKLGVLTSGRSDNLQNFRGQAKNVAKFQLIDGQMYDVAIDMDLKFDWSDNTGKLVIQEAYGGAVKDFFDGKYTDYFRSNYFEVRYHAKGLSAFEIGSSADNVVVDIAIDGGGQVRSTAPTTAPPRPTSQATTVATAKPTLPPVKTTAQPAKTTVKTTTRTIATVPTTSVPKASSDGPYCNCAVDKFGFPAGWSYNDIWLDVVFILDTSEAMGEEALADASALIESFISDGINDFLITDPKAPFYTRVGVISMADTATVLYDLNMTKTDSVTGKATIMKGVDEINVVDAFDVALQMFSDGYTPDRANTRKVIYYMTDSNPGANLNPLNQFKTSQGVIIVDNFLEEGEVEIPRLKELASDGYYLSNSNYMEGLQAFCKANCFCKPNRDTYAGSDPAIVASGGCYHPSPAGVPFNKAKTTCMNDGGIIATVHDDDKGRFLNQLMARSSSKSSYFWIGYEKSDDGKWQWEDQSADSYTNWDVNEPSTAAVSKCAYVDTTSSTLPWGAGNCQIGFPYVCQYTPCSVGNKNC